VLGAGRGSTAAKGVADGSAPLAANGDVAGSPAAWGAPDAWPSPNGDAGDSLAPNRDSGAWSNLNAGD
jgi:hypothetical protein